MTGREKIEAALSPRGTREFAAVFCYEGIYVRDHWAQATALPWWYQFAPDVQRQAAWRRQMLARTQQDWFALPLCPSRRQRESLAIELEGRAAFLADRRTGRRRRLAEPTVGGWSPAGGPHSVHPVRPPQSPAEIDRLLPIARQFDPAAVVADGRADLAARLLEEHGATLYPIAQVSAPTWGCYGLWGFEGMMTLVATRPELIEHACRRLLARAICQVHQAAALGAAGIWVEDCLTDLIGPEAFERLNVPFVRALVGAIRAAGLRSIYYFCGDPAGKWDHLLAVGADALALEESKKGFSIDIEDVVERAGGRCAVLGNLDAIGILQNGSDQQLRAEIARQLAAGRRNRGRFLMSVGSPITPPTPVERVRRYCRLVRELSATS